MHILHCLARVIWMSKSWTPSCTLELHGHYCWWYASSHSSYQPCPFSPVATLMSPFQLVYQHEDIQLFCQSKADVKMHWVLCLWGDCCYNCWISPWNDGCSDDLSWACFVSINYKGIQHIKDFYACTPAIDDANHERMMIMLLLLIQEPSYMDTCIWVWSTANQVLQSEIPVRLGRCILSFILTNTVVT